MSIAAGRTNPGSGAGPREHECQFISRSKSTGWLEVESGKWHVKRDMEEPAQRHDQQQHQQGQNSPHEQPGTWDSRTLVGRLVASKRQGGDASTPHASCPCLLPAGPCLHTLAHWAAPFGVLESPSLAVAFEILDILGPLFPGCLCSHPPVLRSPPQ